MSIPFRCQHCGKDYNAPDHLAGKKIKCKGCGGIADVPNPQALTPPPAKPATKASSPPAPAPSRRPPPTAPTQPVVPPLTPPMSPGMQPFPASPPMYGSPYSSTRPSSTISTPLVVMIAGGLAAMFLVAIALVVVVRNLPSDEPVDPALASDKPAADAESPSANPTAPSSPVASQRESAPNDRTVAANPKFSAAVPPDPLPEALKFKPASSPFSLTMPNLTYPVFPSTPGPFFATATGVPIHAVQLYDARTFATTTRFQCECHVNAKRVLSPDGRYFAQGDSQMPKSVEVWRTSDGQLQQRITAEKLIIWFDLAGDHLLVIERQTKPTPARLRRFNLADGTVTNSIDLPNLAYGEPVALSPGSKQLAIATDPPNRISIYDLASGNALARLPAEGQLDPLVRTHAMAFSQDGSQLVVFQGTGADQYRVAAWDLAGGATQGPHAIAEDALRGIDNPLYYGGQTVQSLPDKSWVIDGLLILDPQNGQVRKTLPSISKLIARYPRYVYDANQYLHVVQQAHQYLLTNQPAATAPGVPTATTGTPVAASGAPAATPADAAASVASAPKVQIPTGPIPWKVHSDPAPAAPNQPDRLVFQTRIAPAELHSVFFSQPTAGKVVAYAVRGGTPGPVSALSPFQQALPDPASGEPFVDFYDSAGSHLTQLSLSRGAQVLDASPDGEMVLEATDGACSVWSRSQSRKIAAWNMFVPAGHKPWGVFVDHRHVIYRDAGSNLVLWNFAEAKAVYVIERVFMMIPQDSNRLSPGGKYLMAVVHREAKDSPVCVFIEALTGYVHGTITLPSQLVYAVLNHAAFSPDGTRLATHFASGPTHILSVFDLNTGETVMHAPARGTTFDWAGHDHLVMPGGHLFDIPRRQYVWREGLPDTARLLLGAVDGRTWLHIAAPDKTVLAALKLPQIETLSALANAKSLPPLVGRGSKVNLEVDVGGPENLAATVRADVTAKLQALGVMTQADAPVRLLVRAQESGSRTVEYKSFGRAAERQTFNMTVTTIKCEVTFFDAANKELWKMPGYIESNAPIILKDVDVQQALQTAESSHWPLADQWLQSVVLPDVVYPPVKPGFTNVAFPELAPSSPAASVASSGSRPPIAGPGNTSAPNPSTVPPAGAPAANAPGNAVAASSPESARQAVAKAYADLLLSDTGFASLRYCPALGRPVLGIRWALATQTGQNVVARDLDSFSQSSGRLIMDGLTKRGEFGASSQGGPPIGVGQGTRSKMLTEARRVWADLLLLVDANSKVQGLSRQTETSVTLRVIDVGTGKELWASEPLKQFNYNLGRQFAEYVLKHIDDTYTLQAADTLERATVGRRMESLKAKEFPHPLSALVEAAFYEHKEWVTSAEAQGVYVSILGPEAGVTFATSDTAGRTSALQSALPVLLESGR